jgi:hypothetical protein
MALIMAIQGQNPNADAQPQKPSRIQQLKDAITHKDPTKRISDAYGIMKEVGGFQPLFNIRDIEQRRKEIIEIMTELNSLEFTIIRDDKGITKINQEKQFLFNSYKLAKLFQLYFITGSPWVRGADNETLSSATAAFIENFEDVGDIPGAFRDLHAEATYLLHLSWQGVDVTNTPAYVMSSTPIFTPANVPRIDMAGGGVPNAPAGTERKSAKSTDI